MTGILLKLVQKLISINNIFSKHNQNMNMNPALSYFVELSWRRIVLVANAKITRRDTLTANCSSGELSSRRIVRGELAGGELASGERSGHLPCR